MARLVGKIQSIPKRGPAGIPGPQGIQGESGRDGFNGKDAPSLEEVKRLIPKPIQGLQGLPGLQGPQGLPGEKGEVGEGIDLGEVKSFVEKLIDSSKPKSPAAPMTHGGGGTPVKFITTITTAEYRINTNELQAGTNIFGVDYAGDVTVFLPSPHERLKEKIIVINDESGSAATNNITLSVL